MEHVDIFSSHWFALDIVAASPQADGQPPEVDSSVADGLRAKKSLPSNVSTQYLHTLRLDNVPTSLARTGGDGWRWSMWQGAKEAIMRVNDDDLFSV